MKTVDKVLELIRDSEWHEIEEIQKEVLLPSREKMAQILSFLEEMGLITYIWYRDLASGGQLKITPRGLEFLELEID